MEKRQTKLVESVELLFQTRVQFPPSPHKRISSLAEDIFYVKWRKLNRRRCDGIEPGPEEFSVENYREQFPPNNDFEDFNSLPYTLINVFLLN